MSGEKAIEKEKMPNMMNSFISGAKKGSGLVFQTVIPNVIFAFALTSILTFTGIMEVLGKLCSPIMMISGLPGEAAMPLILCFSSATAGVTSAASLVQSGILNGAQALMMIPYMFLAGSLFMYTGRVIAVSGIAAKHYKFCYVIAIINAVISLFVMKVILSI